MQEPKFIKIIKKFFSLKKRFIIFKKTKIYTAQILHKLQENIVNNTVYENNDNIIYIAMASDRKYSRYLVTAIASIILSSNDNFFIYIIDDGIEARYKDYINKFSLKYKHFTYSFLQVDKNEISRLPYHRCAPCAYYRAKLANILTNIKKILYLDLDIICLHSIKELFDTDLEGKGIGACLDSINYFKNEFPHLSKIGLSSDNNYINSGIMLMNLDKMRNDNFEELFFTTRYKYDNYIIFSDQDIFNIIFQNDKLLLPQKWNFQVPMYRFPYNTIDFTTDPSIIHYTTGNKPWLKDSKCYFKSVYTKFDKALYASFE
jgi:lipopolysaccharide biosynthesis glycosyltransferase